VSGGILNRREIFRQVGHFFGKMYFADLNQGEIPDLLPVRKPGGQIPVVHGVHEMERSDGTGVDLELFCQRQGIGMVARIYPAMKPKKPLKFQPLGHPPPLRRSIELMGIRISIISAILFHTIAQNLIEQLLNLCHDTVTPHTTFGRSALIVDLWK
jgi:hypothetical protein